MNDVWLPIVAPSVFVHVHDDTDGPKHPLTPEVVRKKRGESLRLDCVVWRDAFFCGVIIGITERTWPSKDVAFVDLSYCRPAKGSGHIGIGMKSNSDTARGQTIITCMRFDEEILDWSRKILSAFKEAGFPTRETDEGYDA